MAQRLKLSLACWDYDRTRSLADGTVTPDGIDLIYQTLSVEETFFRMLRYREFDAAEMSLSSYTVSLLKDSPFIAIPVFPSRMFRHSSIYVNTKSGIETPQDLIGRKIGTPEYQMTAPVWIRGILSDHYGVDAASVEYYCGGEEEPNRDEKLAITLPEKFHIHRIGPGQTLSQMLADGEIDALHTARKPTTMDSRPGTIRRLFPNYKEVEQAYYAETNIFPIMHTVVIRRDVYEKYPWVAMALFKAFEESKRRAHENYFETAAMKYMLPWLVAHVEETIETFGKDWWAYGFAENRDQLDVFLRIHHEQGLSARKLEPEDLFAPECLESFKI